MSTGTVDGDATGSAATGSAATGSAATGSAATGSSAMSSVVIGNGATATKTAPALVTLPVRQGPPSRLASPVEGQRSASMTLLNIWILLFGFVGTQLAWTLRPFFGSPGMPFELFRSIDGTFYGDIIRTIGHLLGG